MSAIETIAAGTHLVHEIDVKRSRFITALARSDSPGRARAFIDQVKAGHPQARHNCSAYLIQVEGRSPHQHSSDDGEPAGTAGTPMLEALRAAGVWNVTAVVTRYFGGILLGASGLTRAYSNAVSDALALAPRARVLQLDVLETTLPPAQAGRIEAEMRSAGAFVLDVAWDQQVTLRIGVDKAQDRAIHELLASLTHGRSSFHVAGTTSVEMDAPRP
ncbi:YigZ family protein [Schaalia sp. 19OD2882]|uniref:IMPACT family protein n=1 Tax=Schaalia sp. 19OD2882 TaxID=2794089 RepID=UPI001C1EE9EC|nr:YigZ family protein [Schaalia sp. 19OD2882]QWW20393.1 YigZ family protein [Schaalia sp. 19OD2882]